jgi:hypothetical protein
MESTGPHEGIPELLDGMTTRHIRMAVLSNKLEGHPESIPRRCRTAAVRNQIGMGTPTSWKIHPLSSNSYLIVGQMNCTKVEN